MLGWRLAISAVLIPALYALFRWDHQVGRGAWPLLALCLLLVVRAAWELNDLLRTRSFETSFARTAALSALIVLAGWIPAWSPEPAAPSSPASTTTASAPESSTQAAAAQSDSLRFDAARFAPAGPIAAVWGVSLLVLFLAAAIRYEAPGKTMETLAAEWLIVSYLGGLLALTAQLRWVAGTRFGYLALGSLLIATKGGDIGAYTLGRLFGRRKMVPRLSPGKTWAGAFGAVLFSSLGTWAFLVVATPLFDATRAPPAPHWCLAYGAVLGIVGLVGDLAESLIKRDVGRKDAAPLFPGFGGLLDLLDSVLYAGPVAWILWNILPLG